MVRLNKFLADCGVAARRKCDDLILSGQVSVNGAVEQRLGTKIDADVDRVHLGRKLLTPARQFDYLLLNKPKGVVTTASDEKGRKTVLDLVHTCRRVYPVGRLDLDSSGALLLTNDGELAYRVTHPKYEIEKHYRVELDIALKPKHRQRLEEGIRLEEGVTSSCRIDFPQPGNGKVVDVVLYQGWNRQIRRMFETVGCQVRQLHRTQIGPLQLKGLQRGRWRLLTKSEITNLKKAVYGD